MKKLEFFFILSLLALSPFASADIPHLISLQGKLTDASDNPISSSTNFVFRIYNASLGGTLAWNETQSSIVPDSNGIFSALLGSATALNIPFNESYWLEVQVNSEVLSPRQRMGSAGYALRSESPWNTTGNNIFTTNAGNVGIGTATPGAKLDVHGGNIQTSGTITASSFSGAGTGLIGTASGLTAGSANSVPWSGVSGKPTSIARIQDLTGSYGSINIAGATNAYGGIKFTDAGNFVLMVRNDGLSGIYNEGSGWKWYFDNNGALTAGTVPWARLSSVPNYAGSSSLGGPATTASALAADGSNCGAGQYAQGVDASGNAQGCGASSTSVTLYSAPRSVTCSCSGSGCWAWLPTGSYGTCGNTLTPINPAKKISLYKISGMSGRPGGLPADACFAKVKFADGTEQDIFSGETLQVSYPFMNIVDIRPYVTHRVCDPCSCTISVEGFEY